MATVSMLVSLYHIEEDAPKSVLLRSVQQAMRMQLPFITSEVQLCED